MSDQPQNQLIYETSPYLLQHANNPVAWLPYNSAAFQRAQELDRPILLSIGYSACHWCHVMAHESFEDSETAALMNERFISIKVDREEMPDVDQIYQQALQLQGEHGGWPLTMFLMPDGTPFYGGTYFPKENRFGRPSFQRLLLALSEAYRNEREKIFGNASQFREGLKKLSKHGRTPGATANFLADSIDRAATRLSLRMDRRQGGFEGAPKFPNVQSLSLLLRAAYRASTGQSQDVSDFLAPVVLTLQKMAAGGIYDQLGGGFSRYSTDAMWLVPHFEKMLYDNALLLRLYSEAYQWTQDVGFARVVQETSDYLERDLRARDAEDQLLGFYTAQDADSEGVEGKYYVWRYDEIWSHLDAASAELVCRVYGVEEGGNWHDPHGHGPEQANILHLAGRVQSDAEAARLAIARQKLLAIRKARIAPQTDDKILASCNGLALTGLAQAGRIFRDHKLIDRAVSTAKFLQTHMTDQASGRLYRSYKNGAARFPGTLDDHAFVAEGYISLYEATADPAWLEEARRLTELCLQLFYDESESAFFLTAADDGFLIERPVSSHDHAVPSGMSVCLNNLLYLAHLTDNRNWLAIVERVTAAYYDRAMENPFAFSNLLSAVDLLLHPPAQIVLTGGADSPLTVPLSQFYLPGRVIAYAPEAPVWCSRLLEGKEAQNSQPTAFVCQNYACQSPTSDPAELLKFLAQAR